MPSIGVYFSDQQAAVVEAAAKASSEKKPSPYIAAAALQRAEREGMMPGNPLAELIAAAEEIGIEPAIHALRKLGRPGRHKRAA